MANKLYNDASVQAIADAIRAKNGKSDTYKIAEMAGAIASIPTKANIKTWKYISTGDAGSEVTQTLVSGDTWVKQHYNAPTLFVVVKPNFTTHPGTGIRSLLMCVASQIAMATSGGEMFTQAWLRYISDAGAINGFVRSGDITNPNAGVDLGSLRLTADGDIRICQYSGSTYALQAGEYDIIAMFDSDAESPPGS